MTTQEIIEGNKLIAEFMGIKHELDFDFDLVRVREYHNGVSSYIQSPMVKITTPRPAFYYHSSWDWLMPVIEKIESNFCHVEIHTNGTRITAFDFSCANDIAFDEYPKVNEKGKTKLSVTFSAVLRYIEWKNNQ